MLGCVGLVSVWMHMRLVPHPLRIMCIGDSITYGVGSPDDAAGYRSAVATSYKKPIEFVGGRMYGSSVYAPCEGYPGKTSYQIDQHVPGAVRTFQPDVALVLCGINDIATDRGNESAITAADGIRRVVADIISARPDCQVYLSTLTPVYNHPLVNEAKWRQLNAFVPMIAHRFGRQVHCVDMSAAGLTPSDFYDGVHPRLSGYRKIARILVSALSQNATSPR